MVYTLHCHESGGVGLRWENWKYFADGKLAWRVGRLNSFPGGPEPAGVSTYIGVALHFCCLCPANFGELYSQMSEHTATV